MKIKIALILLLIFNSCTPKKTQEQQVMEIYNNISQYKERPYYTMQIGGGNCNFEIRVNDMPVWKHLRNRGGISTNVPLNAYILESGIQDVSIKIFPRKGETQLTKYANLAIEIRLYKDVDDPVLEYESVLKYDLKVPEDGMPLAAYKNKFKAVVPYKIKAWQDSQDLTKVEDIEKKVLNFYEMYRQLLKEKNIKKLSELDLKREKNIAEAFYFSKERIEKRIKFANELVLEKNIIMKPIENYIFVYYANDKVVSLLLFNGEHVIRSVIKEDGKEEVSSIRYLQLHMPKGSNKLEVI